MRALPAAFLAFSLTGCFCRPGVIDCTTGRAYPGFAKPLNGGPLDPFVYLAGDTCCECRGCDKGAYTPYGGRTCCGEKMTYVQSCSAPPLRWAAPATPVPPSGHTVHLPPAPPPLSPARKPHGPAKRPASPAAAPAPAASEPPAAPNPDAPSEEPTPGEEVFLPPTTEASSENGPGPRILHDARRIDERVPSRL